MRSYTTRGKALLFLYEILDWDREECILWPYSTRNGYGVLHHKDHKVNAHRLALQLATGEQGEKLHAAHGPCHQPRCINPNHLSWKTPTENEADKVRDGVHQLGSNNHMAKLTEEQVLSIYKDNRSQYVLAEEYGVSQSNISSIKAGQSWSSVTGVV